MKAFAVGKIDVTQKLYMLLVWKEKKRLLGKIFSNSFFLSVVNLFPNTPFGGSPKFKEAADDN